MSLQELTGTGMLPPHTFAYSLIPLFWQLTTQMKHKTSERHPPELHRRTLARCKDQQPWILQPVVISLQSRILGSLNVAMSESHALPQRGKCASILSLKTRASFRTWCRQQLVATKAQQRAMRNSRTMGSETCHLSYVA